jgi:hypothetical protein
MIELPLCLLPRSKVLFFESFERARVALFVARTAAHSRNFESTLDGTTTYFHLCCCRDNLLYLLLL